MEKEQPISYGRRAFKGSVIIFVSMLVASLISFLLRAVLARSLTPSDYGLFFFVYSFLSFFTLFYDLGMCKSLIRHIPIFIIKRDKSKVKSSILFVALFEFTTASILALVFFIFADWFAITIFDNPAAEWIIRILSIWVIFNALYRVVSSTFQGLQDMKILATIRVTYNVLLLSFIFLLIALIGKNIEMVALSYLGASIISFLVFSSYLMYKYGSYFKASIHMDSKLVKKLTFFALPIFIGSISFLIFENVDTILIGMFRSETEVGYYQVAQPIARILWFFPGALSTVLFPLASEMWARKHYSVLSKGTYLLSKLSFVGLLPLVLIIITFPEIVIRVIFGESYLPATHTLQILAAASLGYMMFTVHSVALNGIGKPAIVMYVATVMAIINLISNFVLIPIMGTTGAAVSHFAAYAIGATLLSYFVTQYIKLKSIASPVLKSTVGGIAVLLLISFLKTFLTLNPYVEMIIVLGLGFLAYTLWIVFTQIIEKEDWVVLYRLIPWLGPLFNYLRRIQHR